MDAVVLTWRWQNILSIWIMIAALILVATIIAQVSLRNQAKSDAGN